VTSSPTGVGFRAMFLESDPMVSALPRRAEIISVTRALLAH
jgi:hypothetical protein